MAKLRWKTCHYSRRLCLLHLYLHRGRGDPAEDRDEPEDYMMMSDFLTMLPPGALMMIVAAGLVLVPHHARQVVMLLAIAGSAFSLTAGAGQHLTVALLGFEMMFIGPIISAFPLPLCFISQQP